MILIDTSVWIDFFMGRDNPHAKAVESLVETREDICICGVVLTEVLQGIRNDKEHDKTKTTLSKLVFLPMTQETFYSAADIYRTCRSRGITIRNSIDCMIAAACIQYDAPLLHSDKDFDLISSQFNLKIYELVN
ncbi:MAG: PIN domain nuclease [Chloroflexi bacterium]|nr:PIN domain nuclease [Chloroflexota bacterium]